MLHTVKCALVVFVIAFLLESFVFNMNYFRSSSYNEVKLDSQIDLPLTDDEKQFKFTAQEKSVEFHNLNKDDCELLPHYRHRADTFHHCI